MKVAFNRLAQEYFLAVTKSNTSRTNMFMATDCIL